MPFLGRNKTKNREEDKRISNSRFENVFIFVFVGEHDASKSSQSDFEMISKHKIS